MYTDLHTLSLHDSLPISFSVYEQAGLVRVCLRANAPLPLLADCLYSYAGTAHVSLSHQEYLDALYDDPGLVLAIRGVSFTPYLMSELHDQNGMLVMERSCRSEEHTSELQSLMRISYAVFCLKKKKHRQHTQKNMTHKLRILIK